MSTYYLEKINSPQNMYRFYSLEVTPTLFGSWALIRRWGRIGSQGQRMEEWFSNQSEAERILSQLMEVKENKGYFKPFDSFYIP